MASLFALRTCRATVRGSRIACCEIRIEVAIASIILVAFSHGPTSLLRESSSTLVVAMQYAVSIGRSVPPRCRFSLASVMNYVPGSCMLQSNAARTAQARTARSARYKGARWGHGHGRPCGGRNSNASCVRSHELVVSGFWSLGTGSAWMKGAGERLNASRERVQPLG